MSRRGGAGKVAAPSSGAIADEKEEVVVAADEHVVTLVPGATAMFEVAATAPEDMVEGSVKMEVCLGCRSAWSVGRFLGFVRFFLSFFCWLDRAATWLVDLFADWLIILLVGFLADLGVLFYWLIYLSLTHGPSPAPADKRQHTRSLFCFWHYFCFLFLFPW